MKKYSTTLVLLIIVFNSSAQNNSSNTILVRRDTTILKAEECEWIFKPHTKTVKSVPQVILESVQSGKLKAYDPQTNELIPGNKIYTWRQAADTISSFDAAGNIKYNFIQRRHNPENIYQIRICQDWYFDKLTGKVQSAIKWIELLEEIHSSSGITLGHKPMCRINY